MSDRERVRRRDVRGATACRFCGTALEFSVVDLGTSPLCQTVIRREQLEQAEPFYPLHVRACRQCWLLQIGEFVPPERIFTEYAYFSSYSTSWVEHARRYVEMIVERAELGPDFFRPMDTIKDRQNLEAMHESGHAPWLVTRAAAVGEPASG